MDRQIVSKKRKENKMKKKIVSLALLVMFLMVGIQLFSWVSKNGGVYKGGRIQADSTTAINVVHPTEFTIEKLSTTYTAIDGHSEFPQEGVGAWDKFQLHFVCKVPNSVQSGDKTILTLNESIKFPYDANFALIDDKDGKSVVANASAKAGKRTLELIYTDYVNDKNHKNIQGKVSLVVWVGGTYPKPNDNLPVEIKVDEKEIYSFDSIKYLGIPRTSPLLVRKYGSNYFDNQTFLFTLRFNEEGKKLGQTTIVDRLQTEHTRIDPKSFQIERVRYGRDKYDLDITVLETFVDKVPEYELQFDPDHRGFTLKFLEELKEDGQFVIYYQVKLETSYELRQGNKVENKVKVHASTLSGEEKDYYGRAVYALSEGSANSYFNQIHLRKLDRTDPQKGLVGAEFKITNVEKQQSVILTTDEEGYIRLENILAGEYEIEEVKPPVGYHIDRTIRRVQATSGKATDFKVEEFFNDPIAKKSITVKVEWEKSTKQDVTVHLMNQDKIVESIPFLVKDDVWEKTVSVNSTDGINEIIYSVKEEGEENEKLKLGDKTYQVTYSKEEDVLVVTNIEGSEENLNSSGSHSKQENTDGDGKEKPNKETDGEAKPGLDQNTNQSNGDNVTINSNTEIVVIPAVPSEVSVEEYEIAGDLIPEGSVDAQSFEEIEVPSIPESVILSEEEEELIAIEEDILPQGSKEFEKEKKKEETVGKKKLLAATGGINTNFKYSLLLLGILVLGYYSLENYKRKEKTKSYRK